MSILFGHPGGNPNSHHAALAHFEAGRLEAFCVPWMPSKGMLAALNAVPALRPMAQRFSRRRFAPLDNAPAVQGQLGEMRRLLLRAAGRGSERLSYEANDWLMRTMRRECARPGVTAVHAYEDCSLWQFAEAKRRGLACIYDMPIGYFAAAGPIFAKLARDYPDWLPDDGFVTSPFMRPEQKRREMELADLVLAPSSYVERTIRQFHPDKALARAPYGVDSQFWSPVEAKPASTRLRFINAGQLSLRKGLPVLLAAWKKAALPDAELQLVGAWRLAEAQRSTLPKNVTLSPPCSAIALRDHLRAADAFVFPSFFEGFGLVLLEAMACGLPAIATDSTAAPDILDDSCGRVVPTGDEDALVDALRWLSDNRDSLPALGAAARRRAEECSWHGYRAAVSRAVAAFV